MAIVATNEDSGQFREATTSGEGAYYLAQMVPGRYRISARLEGSRTFDRRGLVLAVGTTLTDLAMAIGTLEESVTVPGNSPISDFTATDVGGNIGTGELAELPAMNRNYFEFSPSTQMGNDTIVSNGQSSQNNNVAVDGGYNGDNALGTDAGAQVRTPLEAIQQLEVITSMYDAEWGRAGGAIVNAVTKQGTNSNTLTSRDLIARQRGLPKAQLEKREWGVVLGGPIVRNKAHLTGPHARRSDAMNRRASGAAAPDPNPSRRRFFQLLAASPALALTYPSLSQAWQREVDRELQAAPAMQPVMSFGVQTGGAQLPPGALDVHLNGQLIESAAEAINVWDMEKVAHANTLPQHWSHIHSAHRPLRAARHRRAMCPEPGETSRGGHTSSLSPRIIRAHPASEIDGGLGRVPRSTRHVAARAINAEHSIVFLRRGVAVLKVRGPHIGLTG